MKPDFSTASSNESQLSLFCAALMEAVWLAAICVVPLLLNPQSSHSAYQPFKYGFWRVLALVGAGAWLLRTIELRVDPRPHIVAFIRSPLSILAGIFALTIFISASLSIYPTASFWGAPETFQGALTYAAELVLFALVACHLRSRDQIERFVTLLLVTSFAVSVFAIVQRFGLDPRYPTFPGNRVLSTAGHPIYLAGYLLMCMPLTVYRAVAWRGRDTTGKHRNIAIAFYAVLFLTQLIAFFCAESRGPIIALGVTMFAFGVLRAAYFRRRRALLILVALAVLAGATLALAGSGLKQFREIPGLKRFAESSSVQKGMDLFRADLWKQAPSIIFAREPLPHPTGGEDRHHHLRPWIGYGPETLECVLPHYYQINDPEAHVIENRFHNLIWDLWFSIGGIGVAAFLGFVLFLFYKSYRRLGFIDSPESILRFWIISILSAIAGVVLFVAFLGIGFAGAGLLGGLTAGLLIHAVFAGFRATGSFRSVDVLIIALLAAMAGRLIDMAFAFATAPTDVLFWTYAGLLIVLGNLDGNESSEKKRERGAMHPAAVQSWLVSAALIALGLVALSISVLHQYRFESFSIGDVLSNSLWDLNGADGRRSLLFLALAGFCIAGSFAFAIEAFGSVSKAGKQNFVGTLVCAGLAGVAFGIWRSAQIADIGPIPPPTANDLAVLNQPRGHDFLFLAGMVALVVVVFGVAFLLSRTFPSAVRSTSKLGAMAGGVMFLVVVVASEVFAIAQLRAAVSVAWAEALDETGRPNLSVAVYRRVLELDPRPYLYPAMMSEALIKLALSTPNVADAQDYFTDAERVLLDARQRCDLNRSSFYLARLYLLWAERDSGTKKTELLQKAMEALRQAKIFETSAAPVNQLSDIAKKMATGNSGDR